MAIYHITKIEYSTNNGSTFKTIPLQNSSAEFSQTESNDAQGHTYTQALTWRYSSAKYYELGKAVANDLRRATHIRATCADQAEISLSPDGLIPDVGSKYFIGNAPGEFTGWQWSYELVDNTPFKLSFL